MHNGTSVISRLKSAVTSRWTQRALFFLTVVFVVIYVRRNFERDALSQLTVDSFWLALGIFLNIVYIMVYALLWHGITRMYGSAIPLPDAVAVWLFSNFGKYLPLKVTGIGFRMSAYRERTRHGYAHIGQLCYLEYVASILGGFVIVLVLLFMGVGTGDVFQESVARYGLYASALFLLLLPPVQRALFNSVLRMMNREAVRGSIKPVSSIILVTAYAGAWLLLGVTLICLTYAVYPQIETVHWPRIILVYALAGVAGMISLFAPSGLGVREGVLIAGLGTFMPIPVAAVISVLARVVATAVDGMGILTGFVYLERTKK